MISASGGRVVADAKSVLVSYDYGLGESVDIPEDLRARLETGGQQDLHVLLTAG